MKTREGEGEPWSCRGGARGGPRAPGTAWRFRKTFKAASPRAPGTPLRERGDSAGCSRPVSATARLPAASANPRPSVDEGQTQRGPSTRGNVTRPREGRTPATCHHAGGRGGPRTGRGVLPALGLPPWRPRPIITTRRRPEPPRRCSLCGSSAHITRPAGTRFPHSVTRPSPLPLGAPRTRTLFHLSPRRRLARGLAVIDALDPPKPQPSPRLAVWPGAGAVPL